MEPPEEVSGSLPPVPTEDGSAYARSWNWDALSAEVRPRLIAAGVKRFGLTREEAEDVAQTVFLRTYVTNPRVRDPIAYLKTAFRFTALNLLKAAGRRLLHDSLCDVVDDRTLQGISRREASEMVRKAFHLVDPLCRKLLCAHFLSPSPSLAASAEAIGFSPKTIWRKIQTCLKRMRECLS